MVVMYLVCGCCCRCCLRLLLSWSVARVLSVFVFVGCACVWLSLLSVVSLCVLVV